MALGSFGSKILIIGKLLKDEFHCEKISESFFVSLYGRSNLLICVQSRRGRNISQVICFWLRSLSLRQSIGNYFTSSKFVLYITIIIIIIIIIEFAIYLFIFRDLFIFK